MKIIYLLASLIRLKEISKMPIILTFHDGWQSRQTCSSMRSAHGIFNCRFLSPTRP